MGGGGGGGGGGGEGDHAQRPHSLDIVLHAILPPSEKKILHKTQSTVYILLWPPLASPSLSYTHMYAYKTYVHVSDT